DCATMQCMQNRNILHDRTADIGLPIEGVNVDDIKLIAAPLQIEKKIEEEVSLGKEASICGTFSLGEVGGQHMRGNRNCFNGNARHKRCVACKKCDMMPTLSKSQRQVGQERLRASEIGLHNWRNQGGNQCNIHHSPR